MNIVCDLLAISKLRPRKIAGEVMRQIVALKRQIYGSISDKESTQTEKKEVCK